MRKLVLSACLFLLILALMICGVVVGEIAAWIKQSKWRRAARRAEHEVRQLRAEVDELRRSGATPEPATPPMPADYTPRLTIPPPAE